VVLVRGRFCGSHCAGSHDVPDQRSQQAPATATAGRTGLALSQQQSPTAPESLQLRRGRQRRRQDRPSATAAARSIRRNYLRSSAATCRTTQQGKRRIRYTLYFNTHVFRVPLIPASTITMLYHYYYYYYYHYLYYVYSAYTHHSDVACVPRTTSELRAQ